MSPSGAAPGPTPTLRGTGEADARLGAHVNGLAVEFLVWAPSAEQLDVHLLGSEEYIPLQRNAAGCYGGELPFDPQNSRYLFRLNGQTERPDPASRWQPEGVHKASAILPADFSWNDSGWKGPRLANYITYEIHVGTYTQQGTFAALIDRLTELQDLGVTAIEIMPVAEFPGARNWGYDGVFPFAVHHAYGGALGLKNFVNACHMQGIAVILDVVYNHLGPEGNYLADFGPYFTDRYRTPWGSALNFDGPYSDQVVRYFTENALQWLDEFHVDALRLDAIHGIVDRNAQPFLACLSSSVEDLARRQNRNIYLLAESDSNDFRVVQSRELGGYGLNAQWSDDFHHALHTLQTGERDGYYEDFGRVADLARVCHSGFVYQGQYSPHRKRRHGSSAATVPASALVVCSQNHDQVGNRMLGERSSMLMDFEALKLSAAVVFLSPFLPLLFMGEEFAETNPFLYFTSHGDLDLAEAVRQGRRSEFASFTWMGEPPDPQSETTFGASKLHALSELTEQQKGLRLFYRELIRLRQSIPALAQLDKNLVETMFAEDRKLLLMKRGHGADQICAMFNFDGAMAPFPATLAAGRWRCRLDSADVRWFGPGSSLPDVIESPRTTLLQLAPHSACLFSLESL